jgi:hypothetical protein
MHARAILLLTLLLATLPATPAWSQSVVLEPDTLDFGSVAIGSTAARAFSLRNDYGAPIVVESVDIEAVPSDGFAVAAPVPPDSLGPGTTRLFWITFRPADASRRTGVVRIR